MLLRETELLAETVGSYASKDTMILKMTNVPLWYIIFFLIFYWKKLPEGAYVSI
jgi:hypothetical protein